VCISDSKYETNTLYQTSIHTTSVSPFTQRLSGPLHSMFCAYRHAVANALHMLYIHTHTIAQPSRTHMRIVTLFFVILALTLTAPCDSTCRNREGRLRSRLQSGGKLCLALHPCALVWCERERLGLTAHDMFPQALQGQDLRTEVHVQAGITRRSAISRLACIFPRST